MSRGKKPRRIGIKVLANGEYEILTETLDFYIRREGNEWAVDVFDAKIRDNEEAYLEGEYFSTLERALWFVGDCIGESKDENGTDTQQGAQKAQSHTESVNVGSGKSAGVSPSVSDDDLQGIAVKKMWS